METSTQDYPDSVDFKMTSVYEGEESAEGNVLDELSFPLRKNSGIRAKVKIFLAVCDKYVSNNRTSKTDLTGHKTS